jgi:hypothetical protein
LQRVLAAIREYRPARFYVFADGWKKGNSQEMEDCLRARRLVRKEVNWPCRASFHFSTRNRGLKASVEKGLTHVFRRVSEAIVLEDDCVASPAFFLFCEENLKKHRRDSGLMSISGSCFVDPGVPIPGRAYLSRYPHCWGWATWRRAWKKYRGSVPLGVLRGILQHQRFPSAERNYWSRVAGELARGTMSSWAYFWIWAHWRHRSRALTPAVNLVKNIGFDRTARNTREVAKLPGTRQGSSTQALSGAVVTTRESEGLDRSVFRNHYLAMSGRRGWQQKISDRWKQLFGFLEKAGP